MYNIFSGRKRSNTKNLPVLPILRKTLENNSRRLRTAIRSAVNFRINEDNTFVEKVKNLVQDLRNIPSHVFGEHRDCANIGYFNCSPTENENNYIPRMRDCGLLEDIELCFNRLVCNASSLIMNMDTNTAEQYNSIVCKFVGGKRINFSLKGSYQTRCQAAAISFNTRGTYYSVLSKKMPLQTRKYVAKMVKKRQLQKDSKNRTTRKQNKKTPTLPDRDYGPDATPEPDLTDDQFEKKKQAFLQSLEKTQEQLEDIEKKTRGQAANSYWLQERLYRLTASHFGDVCKMRKTTSSANKVKNILYTSFSGNEATRWGSEHEPFAIQQFEKEFGLQVRCYSIVFSYIHMSSTDLFILSIVT